MEREKSVRDRWHYGGTIALALLLWMSAGVLLAAPTSLMDQPMTKVRAGLGALLDCQWRGNAAYAVCQTKRLGGTVDVTGDPAGASVQTVETTALVAGDAGQQSEEAARDRETVLHIVAYLLPSWKDSPRWLTEALRATANGGTRHIIKIDDVTILVQRHRFADLDATFALIVVTRRTSLEEWTRLDD